MLPFYVFRRKQGCSLLITPYTNLWWFPVVFKKGTALPQDPMNPTAGRACGSHSRSFPAGGGRARASRDHGLGGGLRQVPSPKAAKAEPGRSKKSKPQTRSRPVLNHPLRRGNAKEERGVWAGSNELGRWQVSSTRCTKVLKKLGEENLKSPGCYIEDRVASKG